MLKKIRKEADAVSNKVARKTVKKVEAKKARQKSVKAKPKPALEKLKKKAKKVKEKAVKKVSPEKKVRSTETTKGKATAREQKKVPLKVKKKRAGDLKKTLREKISVRTEKPGKPKKIEEEIRLPEEYGENELLLMVVDPHTVFASWEITKDSLPQKDDLTARIFDVTGVISEVGPFDHFLEIGIDRRLGSGFFDIRMPGKEVIMEIGLFEGDREFKAIVRSKRVSIPTLLTFDELGIVKKLFESGIPVGY